MRERAVVASASLPYIQERKEAPPPLLPPSLPPSDLLKLFPISDVSRAARTDADGSGRVGVGLSPLSKQFKEGNHLETYVRTKRKKEVKDYCRRRESGALLSPFLRRGHNPKLPFPSSSSSPLAPSPPMGGRPVCG